MALTLIINGEERVFESLESGSNLQRLLEVLGVKPDRVALELNASIASRTAWADILLKDGDKIEVVHFVGGGADS